MCALYAAQGLPDGFVRTGVKLYLIDQGVATDVVGNMVALVSWPWALKWVWGPLIDRFSHNPMGRRRPWILGAQLGLMLTLASIVLMPDLEGNLYWLGVLILTANVFASLQDVSVDAMAVDLLPEEERGVANGFMYGSSYLGNYLGAALIGGLLLTAGIGTAVAVQMAILLSISAFPLLLREHPADLLLPGIGAAKGRTPPANRDGMGLVLRRLGRAFSVRSSVLAALLSLSSMIAVNAQLVFWPVYLKHELGWSTEAYLRLEGSYGVWVALAGCLLGGLLASAVGAKRAVAASVLALSLVWFAHYGLSDYWGSPGVVAALFIAASGLTGLLAVSMFALFMGVAWPPVAATQFTAYMALLNMSYVRGAKLAYPLERIFESDMPSAYLALGAYQLATIGLVLAIDPGETRRKLGDPGAGEH
ncbi:muropeptide transporter [Pirellulimonas nuda]|uniref:Muropeptide transporter n=1 Tax=Pirellulimonas nuda TaxID=2528009 RepID=A0A518DCL9_9BACT|nr:MFS transporter [Pirellulimonas nuda]QDU89234.1 muropeptide transporter [Pirellulimonas nuda]